MSARQDAAAEGGSPVALAATRATVHRREALLDLRRRGEAVRAAGAALGMTPARIATAEALDRLEIIQPLQVESVLAWDVTEVGEWFAALGDDLALDLALMGGDPAALAPTMVALRADAHPATALTAYQHILRTEAAGQGADVRVEVRLALSKRHALAVAGRLVATSISGDSAVPAEPVIFYSAGAWERLLTLSALPLWSRRGLLLARARTCIVVCDAAGSLAGVALEVIGAASDKLVDGRHITRATWRRFQERAEADRTLCVEESQWSAEVLAFTPNHLHVEVRAHGLEETMRRLATLREALAAVYLASAVAGAWEDGLELRFGGARPAHCLLEPETGTMAVPADGLARLEVWAYAHGSPDKLAIARECLARELDAGSSVTLAQIDRAALPALEAARANFAIYLRGQSERYFALRQAAQEAVAGYAEAVRKTVGDLTGDAIQDLYRTGGLALGLLLAWLIQPAASAWAGAIGALLYSGYVAFILRVQLPAREERARLEAAALERRLESMPELTATERAHLREIAGPDEAYHARYARVVRLLYLVLLVLGLVALFVFGVSLAAHVHMAASAGNHK
jgi:hypothetical protein